MSSHHMEKPTKETCAICSQLKDKEYAFQKYGSNYPDTYLPVATNELVIRVDKKPNSDRKLQLRQCPLCGTYYLYSTDYEYFAGGSEDEQVLERLSDEEAAKYLEPDK